MLETEQKFQSNHRQHRNSFNEQFNFECAITVHGKLEFTQLCHTRQDLFTISYVILYFQIVFLDIYFRINGEELNLIMGQFRFKRTGLIDVFSHLIKYWQNFLQLLLLQGNNLKRIK